MADTDYDQPSELSPNPWPVIGPALKRFFTPPTPPPKDENMPRSTPLDQALGVAHGSITGLNGVVPPGLWKNNPGAGFNPPPAADTNVKPPAGFTDPTVGLPLQTADTAAAPSETPPKIVKTTEVRGSDVPNSKIGTPLETAAPPPSTEQGNSGFRDPIQDSGLGRLFNGFNNWRDQNRMTLMALAGGLMQSRGRGDWSGAGRGFSAAAETLPQQNVLNNQNFTMQALINRGYSPDEARAAAGNPTILQQIAPMAFGAKNWQLADIGYNQYGQPVKGWVNNVTREVKGLDGSSMGPGGAGVPGGGVTGVSNGAPTPEMNLHGEDYLKTLDPGRANMIRMIGQGRGPYPSGMMLKTPYGQMLQQEISQAYPDLNVQTFPARQKAWNDWYGGGKHADAMGAITQAAVHGDDLTGTLDALGNVAGGRAVNAPLNLIGDTFGIGKSGENFGPAGMNIHALADELSKIWKGGTNSDAEVRAWEEKFPINGTLDQQKAAMRKAVELYEGGIDKLERMRRDEFGPVADQLPSVVDPQTAARIQHLKNWANNRQLTLPQTQTAPQTQAPQVPPPQQRQIGQVYPTPKGPMRWMQDGWHPVQ